MDNVFVNVIAQLKKVANEFFFFCTFAHLAHLLQKAGLAAVKLANSFALKAGRSLLYLVLTYIAIYFLLELHIARAQLIAK